MEKNTVFNLLLLENAMGEGTRKENLSNLCKIVTAPKVGSFLEL